MDFIERLRQLHEERGNVYEQLKAVVDTAEAENRDLSGEEEGTFTGLSDRLTAIDANMERLTQIRDQGARYAAAAESMGLNRPTPSAEPSITDKLRQVANGEARSIEVAVPSSTAEMRALLTSVDAKAGFLTEKEFVAQLLNFIIEGSSFLSLGPRFITTTHGNVMEQPRQLTHMSNAVLTTENTQIQKLTDATFDRIQLGAYKYAGIAQISHEMLEDEAFGVALGALLVEELGGAISRAVNADLYTGTGTTKPWGLLKRIVSGVTGLGAGGALGFDDLIDLEHSLDPSYRANAAFMINDSTLKVLRKIKDTNNGQYIFQPALTVGAPATILGRRYVVDEHVPEIGLGKVSVLLGDASKYWFRQVRSVRIERSDEYAFDTDLVSWKGVFRAGGDIFDMNAFTAFVGKAS